MWLIVVADLLIVPILKVLFDIKQWRKKINNTSMPDKSIIRHGLEWMIVAVFSAPAIIILSMKLKMDWRLSALLSSVIVMLYLWLVIDAGFNKMRGFKFWYTGSGEKTAANTDKFLKQLPLWLHVLIKLVGLQYC